MCGIAGAIGDLGRDPTPLQRMVGALRLRGPDDSGFETLAAGAGMCWLGNTRLAIQDLSPAGHMPMQDNVNGSWITYNGEVYNFPALRGTLEAEGERLMSRGDTEVILKLYRREGPDFLTRLRGMFAFAIWDSPKQELFLARDRLGKTPLYYSTEDRGRFLFASEIRALLASGLMRPRLDPEAVRQYLANGFMVSPATILENVSSLLPGHWMRVGADGAIREMRCYWTPEAPDGTWDEAEPMEGDRSTFEEAVRMRLVSDVPVGVFLSGGMDSSAIVGALNGTHEQVRTFSLGFPSSDLDETPHARRVAAHWKTQHTQLQIGEKEFYGWLPEALAAMDQPTYDGVNSFFVAKAAHDAGLKVVLSGIGADEIFGGYPTFKSIPLMSFLGNTALRFPSLFTMAGPGNGAVPHLGAHRTKPLWRLADLLGRRWSSEGRPRFMIAFYQLTQILFPSWSRLALLSNGAGSNAGEFPVRYGLPERYVEFLQAQLGERSDADAFSLLAWRLFLGERCLRDVDSMSMGVSLEVRAPFTDHMFVERMLRVPGRKRCVGPPDKPFEHKLLEPFLKGAWQPRGKRGFVMPFASWLSSDQGKTRIGDVLEDRKRISSIGLNPEAVQSLWRGHRSNPARVPWAAVWAVFVLATWCDRHGVSL